MTAPRAAAPLSRSREDRPLIARTYGSGAPRVYLIAGIHGNEREGAPVAAHWSHELETGRVPGTWRLLEDLNPDGSALRRRGNAAGVDLNRNWPARNFAPARAHGRHPLSEPECAAAHDDILAFAPDLLVVFHSTAEGPFVNYDGPAEAYARAFAAAAGWPIQKDIGYPTPGSLGSWAGVDRGLPILTLEFRRGSRAPEEHRCALAGLRALVGSSAEKEFQPAAAATIGTAFWKSAE